MVIMVNSAVVRAAHSIAVSGLPAAIMCALRAVRVTDTSFVCLICLTCLVILVTRVKRITPRKAAGQSVG